MKHTLSVLVLNQPGVLARVAGLFSRRGFNIESLAVGVDEPNISRMTIQVEADDATLEQITKQLHKLIDVIKISDITADEARTGVGSYQDQWRRRAPFRILQVADIFRAKIVDVAEKSIVIEVTGDEGKVDAFVQLTRPYGIIELVRAGKISMVRGSK